MSEISELKQTFDEVKNLVETEFKKAIKDGQAETKKHGDQLGQTKEKLAKMEEKFSAYDKQWEDHRAKLAALESEKKAMEATIVSMQRLGAAGKVETDQVPEELKRFYSDPVEFKKYFKRGIEAKGLATDDNTAGGYLVPHNIAQTIIELNVLTSPMRQICGSQSISVGNSLQIPREGSTAFSVGLVSERGSRAETTSGSFAMLDIPTHEYYAKPLATQTMLDDTAFDVEGWISRKVGVQLAKLQNTHFVTGDGFNKPQGIASGGSDAVVCTAAGAFTAALLIDLQHSLEEPYASNATWVSKRVNFGKIRQLTGSEGFLWQPGISAAAGPTILGRPYVAANDVATIVSASAGAKVMYFGDFQSGYMIVDRIGIRMLRDPFSSKPNVEFYTTQRVGGQVVLPEAIKIGTVNS